MSMGHRSVARAVLAVAGVLLFAWTSVVAWSALDPAEIFSAREIMRGWMIGGLPLLAAGLAAALIHWRLQPAEPTPATSQEASHAEPAAVGIVSLQIRAAFSRVDSHSIESLLAMLAEKDGRSALAADLPDPQTSLARAGMTVQARFGLAMDWLARILPDTAVLPVYTLAPELTVESRFAARQWLGLMVPQTSLPLPLLLREKDQDGGGLAALLQQIHAHFEQSPTLSRALLVCVDGHLVRGHYPGPHTPPRGELHDSVVVLLISRSVLPPQVRNEAVAVDGRTGRRRQEAWAWWRDRVSAVASIAPDEPEGRAISSEFAAAYLRELQKTEGMERASDLSADPCYPLPWTTAEVESFDDESLLAQLPAPVQVELQDTNGTALPRLQRQQRITEAWCALRACLPAGPLRVWHDSQLYPQTTMDLRIALARLPQPLDLDDTDFGTDLYHRFGPLGSSTGAIGVALAARSPGSHVVVLPCVDGLLLQPVLAPLPSSPLASQEPA
ncbi:DUF2875 family protein [uncultured Stenotrophomonas sp.]|uniref:DUF2875 family protein n=1 Tax=uncultured Stenotrophomonas sp. TaxID=165438 RepID=UPI0025F7F3B9|nr:DUF2875 family protein [uncultured Stenotrophomonas sp.]